MHVPNFGGCQGRDKDGGENSIQFINFGRVSDKILNSGNKKLGGGVEE